MLFRSLSNGFGWRPNYFILSILAFVIFIAFSKLKMTVPAGSDKIDLGKFRESLTDKKFLIVCVCFILYAGSEGGTWGWMSTFLKKGMHISINASGFIVGAFWMSMAIGRIICGTLTKYFQVENITIFLSISSGIVVILSGLLQGQTAMFIISVALGLAFSSQYPFLLTIGSKIRSNATSFSLLVGSGGMGIIIVPFIMGWIGDYFSIRAAMMSPSILFFTLAAILFFRRSKQDSVGVYK